uniref:Uncharacterized protein n=1 Tax=Siphoviridae sp. cteLh2 TaxID=2825590 RepID=A0A8S5U5X9_9CAUD|nr:MAG TPA: hypothetical protein [Siphoviridae sp. cteLh2]
MKIIYSFFSPYNQSFLISHFTFINLCKPYAPI